MPDAQTLISQASGSNVLTSGYTPTTDDTKSRQFIVLELKCNGTDGNRSSVQ